MPFFYAAVQPAMKNKIGLEMPARFSTYCDDFIAAVGAAGVMQSAGGWSIKELAASKDS